MEYVNSDRTERAEADQLVEPSRWRDGADHDCFLCRAAAKYGPAEQHDRRLLVVSRNSQTVIVLNRYPYHNCHALVAPLRHVGEF